MDWQGLGTAVLDVERRKQGLPTLAEELRARALREQELEKFRSEMEGARLGREKTQAEIEALPGQTEQRSRLIEAQIRNLDEPPRAAAPTSSEFERFLALPPEQQKAVLAARTQWTEAGARDLGEPVDRAAWTPQYDRAGNLLGFFHRGQFISREASGVPGDAARPMSAGEKGDLALLSNPARLPALFRESLARVRAAEAESPISAGTGVVMGNIGNLYRRVDTSGPGGDFDAARKQVRQVVYGLSGKQLNESELEWLDSITPNLADPGVDEQINRFDAFVTALIEAKKQGISDPFSAARLGFGIQRTGGIPETGKAAPGGGTSDPLEGRTATGPGGQKLVRRGGQWVPR